jgi:hypothetical protein
LKEALRGTVAASGAADAGDSLHDPAALVANVPAGASVEGAARSLAPATGGADGGLAEGARLGRKGRQDHKGVDGGFDLRYACHWIVTFLGFGLGGALYLAVGKRPFLSFNCIEYIRNRSISQVFCIDILRYFVYTIGMKADAQRRAGRPTISPEGKAIMLSMRVPPDVAREFRELVPPGERSEVIVAFLRREIRRRRKREQEQNVEEED